MPSPSVSVIIPTLGRCQEVIQTVQDLLSQSVVPSEILVIDQNVPSFKELDDFLKGIAIVRHYRSLRPGTVVNTNAAIELATGEILLFLDDDVRLEKDLVEQHLAHYKNKEVPRLGGIAGRVEQPSGDLDPDQILEVGKYHQWTGRVVANFNAQKPSEVDIAPGGNMSFYRKVLVEVGGCDVNFGGNAFRFETDLSLRVRQAGYQILFEPKASLKHLMAPRGGNRVQSKALHTYYFVVNGLRLYRRHSPSLGLLIFVPGLFFYLFLKSLYNLDFKILGLGLKAIVSGVFQNMEMLPMEQTPVSQV